LSTRGRPFTASPQLIGLLTVTARLVQEQVAARLQPLGISYAQAVALVRLYRTATGRLSQTDLIDSLALSRASGTLVLSQLEARGLVARSADPADARRLVISMTEAGSELEEPLHAIMDEVEQVVLRSLGPAEVTTSLDAMCRMFRNVKSHRRGRA
jgi:DNA-binding MarR family transcriptional regulator